MTTTTRCFFGEDNSAISLPIELKLSEMVDFTFADVIYYVSCCLMTRFTKFKRFTNITSLLHRVMLDYKAEQRFRSKIQSQSVNNIGVFLRVQIYEKSELVKKPKLSGLMWNQM